MYFGLAGWFRVVEGWVVPELSRVSFGLDCGTTCRSRDGAGCREAWCGQGAVGLGLV